MPEPNPPPAGRNTYRWLAIIVIPLIRYRAASRGACAASVGIGIVAFVLGFPIASFFVLVALGGRM